MSCCGSFFKIINLRYIDIDFMNIIEYLKLHLDIKYPIKCFCYKAKFT